MTEADSWATPAPQPDLLAAERAVCLAESEAARVWLRSPDARRMRQPEAERYVMERLPMAVLAEEDWARHRIVREAPRYDGSLTVTCPCGCGHTFDVGLRGDEL